MERRRLVALEGGRKTAHLDVMRTRVIQQMRANGWRRLAITSPGPGCGKTTTCLNLAFSLGRQPDLRTILAEVDLRRPSLAKTLGLRERQSFGEVLAGHAALGPNAVRYGTNLALSSNHGPVRNTSELLQGASVRPALAAIEAEFAPSLMIFDLPPMLASDDAMAFVPHVDAVLIVAAAERSTVREVDLCERELAVHTNVMGVVLNKCRFLERELDYSSYA
ncbi:MAG: CpsD/CapB family tyrosine-protein kinase [Gemmobacter sp.]